MRTILETLKRRAGCRADYVALCGQFDMLTFGALCQQVEKLTALLAILFAGPGAIALCLENSVSWVLLDLAFLQLGRPIVLNPNFFKKAQRKAALNRAGVKALISDSPAAGLSYELLGPPDLTSKQGVNIGRLLGANC